MKKFFLFPAQYIVVNEPALISTILGSCVGIAFFDQKTKISGLCHYLLASDPISKSNSPRYGSYVIPKIVDEMVKRGASRKNLKAKVYGGGTVVNALKSISDSKNIGIRNAQVAEELLSYLKIEVLETQVGGDNGRKIYFETETFKVECQEIKNTGLGEKAGILLSQKQTARVLVVDDSATARNIFTEVLSASPKIKVIGSAVDPYDAREKIVRLKPDVITLDIEMPRMNGVTFLKKLMSHYPLPVVMISSLGAEGAAAQKAMQLGAVDFIHKPSQFDPESLRSMGPIIIEKVIGAANSIVKTTAENKIEKTVNMQYYRKPAKGAQTSDALRSAKDSNSCKGIELICIGGNTGALSSLRNLLKDLAQDSPPIVVAVSTIAPIHREFIEEEAKNWKIKAVIADDTTFLQPATVYFAPHRYHIGVCKKNASLRIKLTSNSIGFTQKPCFDYLISTANKSLQGNFVVCLLSSFGMDGVEKMVEARNLGAITIVENPETASCPYGPTNAIESGAAEHVARIDQFASLIMETRNKNVA